MAIKTSFSIKDLENMTGIKTHTIRMWERRYKIVEPERTDTNIRTYNLQNFKKFLNVGLLNAAGHKVSKIAQLSEAEMHDKVKELTIEKGYFENYVNKFKVAMLTFDQNMFEQSYSSLLEKFSFKEIFLKVFVLLLNDLGMLWLTNTIKPSHEHFISTLIKQKLLLEVEKASLSEEENGKVAILFLPLNEMHDLGLLYIHLVLLELGYKSIFLGPNVPIDDLAEFDKLFEEVTFISYFTVEPQEVKVIGYLEELSTKVLKPAKAKLNILGRKTRSLDTSQLPEGVTLHASIKELVAHFTL